VQSLKVAIEQVWGEGVIMIKKKYHFNTNKFFCQSSATLKASLILLLSFILSRIMDEDWNDKFFSELSVNTIGILSWDDNSNHWIVTTVSNHMEPNIGCTGMVWDSATLTWKGNDIALETFKGFDFE
jgi:hypothetical protein